MIEKELCHSCNKNESGEETICPYSELMSSGGGDICNCCNECYQECIYNI